MATSMIRRIGTCNLLRTKRFHDFYRTILSDSYNAKWLWQQRLITPYLKSMDPKKYGIELLKQFEVTGTLSSIDVELFANKVQELDENFLYIAREIITRYRHCNNSIPVRDSIMHALVRGYIEGGYVNELIPMIQDRYQYGIFPDDQAMCLLLDHLLEAKNYPDAAKMAYEVMLQEEYGNLLKNSLALTAAVKHYKHTMDFTRVEPEPKNEDDIEYVPIKVIRNLYYDDHFDIKDERFLLGKTLYNLSKNIQLLNPVLSKSLQFIGLGLYEKFEEGNRKLARLLEKSKTKNSTGPVVYSEALKQYQECLETAPTRDPDAEPVSMGDKTMDDEIELLKLTPTQKADCLTQFQELLSSMTEEQMPSENIETHMDQFLEGPDFQKLEKKDSEIVLTNYERWVRNWNVEVQQYRRQVLQTQKQSEIHDKLNALQEREELLSFFNNNQTITYLNKIAAEEKKGKIKEKEEYVLPPGVRNVKTAIKRRK